MYLLAAIPLRYPRNQDEASFGECIPQRFNMLQTSVCSPALLGHHYQKCDSPLDGALAHRPPKTPLRVGPVPVRKSAPDCPGNADPTLPLWSSPSVPNSLLACLPSCLSLATSPHTTGAVL